MLHFLTDSRLASGTRRRPALVLPVLLALTACATAGPSAARSSRHAVVTPSPEPADDAQFYAFIKSFRAEALKAGISPSDL